MARTSKRKRRLESQELLEKKTEKAYVAGIYARLSVDHQDGDEVSIETQIEMGKTFIETQDVYKRQPILCGRAYSCFPKNRKNLKRKILVKTEGMLVAF